LCLANVDFGISSRFVVASALNPTLAHFSLIDVPKKGGLRRLLELSPFGFSRVHH
jgi:hypothetical protein